MASLPPLNAKLRRFKHGLVADLYTQHGLFWDEVRSLRAAFEVTPVIQLPPPVGTNTHFPSHDLELAGGVVQQMFRDLWLRQVFALRDRVVPEVYRLSDLFGTWDTFLSACLLYDPPETDLLEFAAYADPVPMAADGDERVPDDEVEGSPSTPVTPITRLPDPFRARDDAHWYRDAIIDEIGKRFLEPRGLDIWEMYGAVIGEIRDFEGRRSNLGHEYADRQLRNEPQPYILVTAETTEEDVKRAFRSIKSSRGYPMEGKRSNRDQLTAIQCAVLYERHNGSDPQDPRKRTWTYEKLADRFELGSARAASAHVEEGRALLRTTPQPKE